MADLLSDIFQLDEYGSGPTDSSLHILMFIHHPAEVCEGLHLL